MKFNWGTGIAIFIVCFMAFILGMVVKATQTRTDLYADDYYAQEITYQDRIAAKKNSESLNDQFTVRPSKTLVTVQLPESILTGKVSGSLHFYRPNDAALDQTYELAPDGNTQRFALSEFASGTYLVKANFTAGGKNYYFEKPLLID